MRIAYIAPYQGPTLIQRRPIINNRSLAGTTKMETIAKLLRAASHEVEIISQGEVVHLEAKFHPGFRETELFDPQIPVFYASSLPVRFLNGYWSDFRTLNLFKARHKARPFDAVLLYNMQTPQVACARHAIRRLGLPVILEYEDDVFVDVYGGKEKVFTLRDHKPSCRELLKEISGGIGVSPYLVSQWPDNIPSLLLRGVIGDDLLQEAARVGAAKKNYVLYAGVHRPSKGVAQLIDAWKLVRLPDWELHITGFGQTTEELKKSAAGVPGIVFHGLVDRPELVRLMCSARICANPHELSQTPGNVFAFKIIEYLATGAHVISTPMGTLEPEVEAGITYMPDNAPATIAATLQRVIAQECWQKSAAQAVCDSYGPVAVKMSLDNLIHHAKRASRNGAVHAAKTP
jgi:glycosyltransferase involved in cell wall biosynthesis